MKHFNFLIGALIIVLFEISPFIVEPVYNSIPVVVKFEILQESIFSAVDNFKEIPFFPP